VEALHLCTMKCMGREEGQKNSRVWGRMEGCLVGKFMVVKGMGQCVVWAGGMHAICGMKRRQYRGMVDLEISEVPPAG